MELLGRGGLGGNVGIGGHTVEEATEVDCQGSDGRRGGGDRGVLLMQSSGVGNCINMLSLTRVCRMPLLILVTMRGEWGEFNPWQVPMGQNTNQVLTEAGVLTFKVTDKIRIQETVEAAAKMAFEGPAATSLYGRT